MTVARGATIGLGSNLGDARALFAAALDALGRLPQTRVLATSSYYASAPFEADGPDYLNAVARIETRLSPRELLEAMQRIELAHGRVRGVRNAPRTLDLDLLLYADERIDEPGLVVPHPRLHERAFVLVPLAEIAPAQEVPGLGAVTALLSGVVGQRIVKA